MSIIKSEEHIMWQHRFRLTHQRGAAHSHCQQARKAALKFRSHVQVIIGWVPQDWPSPLPEQPEFIIQHNHHSPTSLPVKFGGQFPSSLQSTARERGWGLGIKGHTGQEGDRKEVVCSPGWAVCTGIKGWILWGTAQQRPKIFLSCRSSNRAINSPRGWINPQLGLLGCSASTHLTLQPSGLMAIWFLTGNGVLCCCCCLWARFSCSECLGLKSLQCFAAPRAQHIPAHLGRPRAPGAPAVAAEWPCSGAGRPHCPDQWLRAGGLWSSSPSSHPRPALC